MVAPPRPLARSPKTTELAGEGFHDGTLGFVQTFLGFAFAYLGDFLALFLSGGCGLLGFVTGGGDE